ncbi:hypothetical protein N7509_002877 [Penicillium cosmopolitanum]|uniref:Uncharacterized protein n=1 Tax=Penicillium cosmopolitanum TaxID=1131564 RepID=A0A9W9W9Z5_9EURO|nr:uncharacterized protein N7509_002877 [Penicillium cosmopolitanum]KAJ5408994.1 hypothetical protein N7509_002877 [Penicillium cosmopolitanum]
MVITLESSTKSIRYFLTNLTGPLSRLTVFGQPLIIVNDRETAAQLFEKSAKHSSKPDSVFADELYERL